MRARCTFTNQTIIGMMKMPKGEEPEACPARERRLAPVLLVHVPDLGRDDERHDGADDDPDDEAEHPPIPSPVCCFISSSVL